MTIGFLWKNTNAIKYNNDEYTVLLLTKRSSSSHVANLLPPASKNLLLPRNNSLVQTTLLLCLRPEQRPRVVVCCACAPAIYTKCRSLELCARFVGWMGAFWWFAAALTTNNNVLLTKLSLTIFPAASLPLLYIQRPIHNGALATEMLGWNQQRQLNVEGHLCPLHS